MGRVGSNNLRNIDDREKFNVKFKALLVSIILAGIILRLVNSQKWMHFEMDEEVIAWKVREFVLTGKPFLIGGGTPYGFHVGPAFYYLSAIPLFFSKLDPAVWGIWGAAFGGLAVLLAYKAGKALYSRKTGLLLALFWAVSFVQIFSDRHWWPMVLNPLLGLLAVWFWREIIASKGWKWWLALGAALAFAWQADLSNLILFLGTGAVGLILLIQKRLRGNILGILGCLGILGMSIIPLLIFEMRHPGANWGKFAESRPVFREISFSKIGDSLLLPARVSGNIAAPAVFYDGNLLNFYSWDKSAAEQRLSGRHWLVTMIGCGLLIQPIATWFVRKRNSDLALSVLILSGWTGILIFGAAGGDLYDFYLAPLYSAPLIIEAVILGGMIERRGMLGILGPPVGGLVILEILGINLGIYAKVYHPQGLKVKKEVVEWSISQVGDNSFGLDVLSKSNRYNGMRYLYMLYDREPTVSYMDESLFWLYEMYEPAVPDKFMIVGLASNLTAEQAEKINVYSKYRENQGRIGVFDIMILNNEVQNYQID